MEHSTNTENFEIANPLAEVIDLLKERIHEVIVGQDDMVHQLLAGMLADGHILLEGVPGVAKTLTAKMLAKLVSTGFSRIQFTPDLMPSDVLGTSVFNQQSGAFQFRPGPIFSNIVLIDEINRAPAKTQSALFEVMEERQVTIDGHTHHMRSPFMVIATQNPIEHEGTYRLPEAQLDRFAMKINVGYPNLEEEVQILEQHNRRSVTDYLASAEPVITPDALAAARSIIHQIHIEPKLLRFIAELIQNTRNNSAIYLGASPRASIAIMKVAKAFSVLNGRVFVIPEDIIQAAYPVLRHRLSLTPEKEMEGLATDDVIRDIITSMEVPR
jgi:MoxR-like ATPase